MKADDKLLTKKKKQEGMGKGEGQTERDTKTSTERERDTERERERDTERQRERERERDKLRLFSYLTLSLATKLSHGRTPCLTTDNFTAAIQRQNQEAMTSVSAGHILLPQSQPVGSGCLGIQPTTS